MLILMMMVTVFLRHMGAIGILNGDTLVPILRRTTLYVAYFQYKTLLCTMCACISIGRLVIQERDTKHIAARFIVVTCLTISPPNKS
jgi:hypothetical protein